MIPDLKKDFSNIKIVSQLVEAEYSKAIEELDIDGKNLEIANIEQPSLIARYDEIKVSLKTMVEYAELKVKEREGDTYVELTTKSPNEYSDRAKFCIINADPKYLELSLYSLQLKELYLKFDSLVKAFEQRSYSLTNIVRIREKELENITLYTDDARR